MECMQSARRREFGNKCRLRPTYSRQSA